jgi:CDGSH-type Zn-finger protein
MPEPKVTILKNGPYLVEGGVLLRDADGNPVEGGADAKYALCRCGASANKPFCDGAHSKEGFEG